MKKRILQITLLLISIPIISLFSQSNEELDRFLGQEKADLYTSVWLIYLSAETLSLDAGQDEAIALLLESKHAERFEESNGESLINYGEFSMLIMDAFDLPGGLFYSIFKSPRYAAREMTYKRLMPGDPKPGTILTPWEVTTSVSQVLAWSEAQR